MPTLTDTIDEFQTDAGIVHQFVHGDATTVVQTEGGPVRSPAKLIADLDANISAIATQTVADYASLRAYIGSGDALYVTGYAVTAKPTGIAGQFVRDDSDTSTADNGGTVIVAGNSVRWKRAFEGVVDVMWFGADPASDSTAPIQSAINFAASVGCILSIARGYPINVTGLTIPSNSHVKFARGGALTLLAHNATSYQILRIWDAQNVMIESPTIDGRKDLNLATTGEWGMGISICGSTNVRVIDPETRNCWGDGVYIGASSTGGQAWTQDVRIVRHHDTGSRRQGMSIVSVRGCVVDHPVWENISGTPPSAGLDIEPNDNTNLLEGIRVVNPITRNCVFGIQIWLAALPGATNKYIDIEIIGHRDAGSASACSVSSLAMGSNVVAGRIEFMTPTWADSLNTAFVSQSYDASGPVIELFRPTIINPNRNGNGFTGPADASKINSVPFLVFKPATPSTSQVCGAVRIVEPTVIVKETNITALFHFEDLSSAQSIANCSFIDPLRLDIASTSPSGLLGISVRSTAVSDKHNAWQVPVSAAGNYAVGVATAVGSFLMNAVTNYQPTSTLQAGSPDMTFINNQSGGQATIRPPSGSFIELNAGQYYGSNVAGSRMKVRCIATNVFTAVEKSGVWSVFS